MHRIAALAVVTASLAGIVPAIAEGPTPKALFNGKDLAGWESFLDAPGAKAEDVWSVRDALLVCKGEPMGYLCTKAEYTNFRLAVEWRWAPGGKPGNSGVLMRLAREERMLPRCYEAQLKSGNAGDIYGFQGMPLTGDAARLKKVAGHKLGGDLTGVTREKGAENPPGEWNRYEIAFEKGTLSLSINGQKVNEARECSITPGRIALQSEGGEIHFRAVEITPLPE